MAEKKRSIAVWILLGLLMVGLVGFGSTSLTGTTNAIGRVGDREITAQEYFNTLRRQIDGFSRQIGVPITFAQAQSIGLDRQVLAQLVSERALDNELDRLGLSAGDVRVRDTILAMSDFQGLDGSFDRERYRMVLQAQGLDEAEFEGAIRSALVRQLIEAAVLNGTPEPQAQADILAAWAGETRDIAWATIGPEALAAPVPAPTDADLQTQYEADPAAYTRPEIRSITYAWVTPEMIQDSVIVDEADVRALYESRIAEFVSPERRLVERLVYPDEAAAAAARARLDAGEAGFEALVTERGLELADTDMGDVTPDDLGGAAEGVFAAAAGDVVGPLPSPFGPALYRVNAVLAAQETPLEAVADDLRGELANQRARRMILDMTEDLINRLAGGATIEELVESTEMQLGTIDWFEGMSEGIAAYDSFRSAAAAVQADDFPELGEFDDGGVFTLRLDGVTPPALQPLDEVRDRVAADWTAAATADAILAEAERLAALVRDGGFDQPGLGLVPTLVPGLRRSDFLEGTPPGFVETVFSMAAAEVAVIPDAAGAIVVALQAVNPADMTDPAVIAEKAAIGGDLAQAINRDLFDAFALTIQLGTEISIDEAAVASVNAQMQ